MGFRVKDDKQINNSAPCNNCKETSALKLGTWNVHTMIPGFSDELPEELWIEARNTVQKAASKTIPKKRKCKKAKRLSNEALQIAEKGNKMQGR